MAEYRVNSGDFFALALQPRSQSDRFRDSPVASLGAVKADGESACAVIVNEAVNGARIHALISFANGLANRHLSSSA